MRVGLIAAFLVCLHPGLDSQTPVGERDTSIVDERFFSTLDKMIPVQQTEPSRDRFSVQSARWNESDRSLYVKVATDHEKGTLLTLTGLPESTMLDTFQISGNHEARYVLPLAVDQAIPCQVAVRSAFATETVPVADAPMACQRLLQLSGIVDAGSERTMANAWVTVAVNETVFTTFTDSRGHFSLELYSHLPEARVSITATGKVDNRETVIQLYSGNIDELFGRHELGASVWAKEILGRRHQRRMLAALDPVAEPESLQHASRRFF